MSASKVDKPTTQVKLIFGAVKEGKFPLERLMEEIGLEFHALATSAGVIVMKAFIKAEEEHLAGERQLLVMALGSVLASCTSRTSGSPNRTVSLRLSSFEIWANH